MRTWLIVIGALVAFGILLDSIRRMRKASRDSQAIDFQMQKGIKDDGLDYSSELPNGGARSVGGAVKPPPPKPTRSQAYLAKEAAKEKREPSFHSTPSLEDTQKLRRTPTISQPPPRPPEPPRAQPQPRQAPNLEQSVPLLMEPEDRGEATFSAEQNMLNGGVLTGKPRVVPRKPVAEPAPAEEQEVIVINVMSRQPEGFIGAALLETILSCGMRFGAMNIFHQYAPAPDDDCSLFSMANIVKPGVFDLNNMQSFQTPGVSLFMIMPLKGSANLSSMDVFDQMLATARKIAEKLDGELKDERRSVMTGQTIEHCRQRISEFSRRKLSRSGKFTADT